MDSIVDVDAGEDGEDVGLQERDQQFKRGQRDSQPERQYGASPADDAHRAEHGDEACEHFQRNVACQHIGEQSHAVRHLGKELPLSLPHYYLTYKFIYLNFVGKVILLYAASTIITHIWLTLSYTSKVQLVENNFSSVYK